jgi:hypothetical protein
MKNKKAQTPKKKQGRPTKYLRSMDAIVEKLAIKGFIDTQLAKAVGIAESTLTLWKKKYPSLIAAIKRGKAIADIEIEDSLNKRAKGYEYEEVHTEVYNDVDGNKRIHKKVITKTLPPDPTSMIFWLKNRKPKDWRDKKEIEVEGDGKFTLVVNETEKGIQGEKDENTETA